MALSLHSFLVSVERLLAAAAPTFAAVAVPALVSFAGVASAAPAPREDVAAVREIDGQPVLFQYGRPVPAFLLPEPLPPTRRVIPLDGEWLFAAERGEPAPPNSPPTAPEGLAWRQVLVPHVWDHEPGLETFDGPVWYRRRFGLPEPLEGRRVRLVLLGAADEATVHVNGVRAGYHRGAYMPFAIDVTDLVRPGEENDVAVVLRRRAWGTTERGLLPPGDHDWWLYGGLFQSVYLEIVPEVSVARILAGYESGHMKGVVVVHNAGARERRIAVRFDPGWFNPDWFDPRWSGPGGFDPHSPDPGGSGPGRFEPGRIDGVAAGRRRPEPADSERRQPGDLLNDVTGPETSTPGALKPQAPRLESEIAVPAGQTAAVPFSFPASAEFLWTPERPRTFEATAELSDAETSETIDIWREHYGLADVAVAGTQILFGGEPLFIKGVNWHADDPEVGAALGPEHLRRDFELMLAAGANLVRFSHYPRHPEAYRLADRLGLLVMDEAPNYWMDRAGLLHQLEDGLSATYVRSMVWNHMNHPSVILWSVLNESETGVRGGRAARDFLAEMAGSVRALDLSHRPVTYASNHLRDDVGFDLVDVIGINEYFGFFYGAHHDLGPLLDFLHLRYPDKPVLITEFGDWAVYGTGRETTQAFTFREHWRQMVERSRFVAGGIWWVFADHKSRHQPASAIPYISTMGMVDRDRRPKALFHVFRDAPFPPAGAAPGQARD